MAAVKLTAKWQLDAAMLSRPVDLTALVSMSRTSQEKFLEDNTLPRLISALLNEKNTSKSDKDTKLDVLNILGNVAFGSKSCCAEVRLALGGVSEWFDEYIATEESDPQQEPELHKAMVLLLARCWNYSLKTEDVLELCQGDRCVALCTVVGLLEDGYTYFYIYIYLMCNIYIYPSIYLYCRRDLLDRIKAKTSSWSRKDGSMGA
jgi:hypothetical protein